MEKYSDEILEEIRNKNASKEKEEKSCESLYTEIDKFVKKIDKYTTFEEDIADNIKIKILNSLTKLEYCIEEIKENLHQNTNNNNKAGSDEE